MATREQHFARKKQDTIEKVAWMLSSPHRDSILSRVKELDQALERSNPLVRNTALEGVVRAAAEELVNRIQRDLGLGVTRIVRIMPKTAKKHRGGGRGGRMDKPHWTQRPENKALVKATIKKLNAAKAARAKEVA